MNEPLIDLLAEFRRSLRRAGMVRGFALLGLMLVLGLAVVGGLDYLLRPSGRGARLLFTLAALGPSIWVLATRVLPVLRARFSDVELARRIESCDPRWRGQLAAATEFISREPVVGSAELQARVVENVSHRMTAEPPRSFIDKDRLRRAVLAAVSAIVIAFIFACVSPLLVQAGLLRLALPFASVEWPRSVDLVIVDDAGEPLAEKIQIGRGQTLRFKVKNLRGDVPDDLALEIITPGGGRRTEPVPIAEEAPGEREGREVGVGSLYAAEGPLRFRVVGGDHRTMRYVVAEVVPPPVFDAMRVTVSPPSYLGAESKAAIVTTGGATSGIVGSTVSIKAKANKPLSSAELLVGDRSEYSTTISEDGRTVTAVFPLEKPGLSSYWFRLRDRGGFENPEAVRYELRVAADSVPAVVIKEPADDLSATADADLPVLIEASDDQWLTSVRLRFGDAKSFLDAPTATVGRELQSMLVAEFDGADRTSKGMFPILWSIGSLELRPGDRLTFRGEATDAYDLGPPHVGLSSLRTVLIVSASEKREELLDRQTELLNELADVRRDEARVSETVDSLLAELAHGKTLPADRLDLLAGTELEQRRIAAKLSDPESGLRRFAVQALSELTSNRLDDRILYDRLGRIATELKVLEENALPAADRGLTAARKAESNASAQSALDAAKGEVAVVLNSLESLLQDLGAWRNRRDLAIEANELLAIQRDIREETVKTGAQTLGAITGRLTNEQTEALERLGRRQIGLSDRLARLNETIDQLIAPAEDTPDSPSEESFREDVANDLPPDSQLKDAAALLRAAAMPAAARAAGESIRENDLGDAGRIQQELLSQLQALEALLARSDRSGFGEGELQKASSDLARLAQTQQQILDGLQDEAGLDDDARARLTQDQSQLREEAAGVARALRSASAVSAAALIDEAARSMSRGSENLSRHDDEAAEQNAERATELLKRAERVAKQQAERAGQRSSDERVASAVEAIQALASRQANVNQEVRQLDESKTQSGSLSRSQLLSIRNLVESQNKIAVEAEEIAVKLEEAAIVASVMRFAIAHMRRVAASLTAKDTDEDARFDGDAAERHLEIIVTLLGHPSSQPDSNAQDAAPQGRDAKPSHGLIAPLVQLELMKALQEDILSQTEAFDRVRASRDLTDVETDRLHRLGEQQQSLLESFKLFVDKARTPNAETSE